jgi:hypothetical protein
MRAFAALQYRSTADSIEIEFEKPTLHKFIHEVYKQVARGAWQHAYLFKTYATPLEQQARNRKDITTMLEDSLDTVIDSFLPWKDIAKNYFKDVPATAAETVAAAAAAAAEEEEDDEPAVKDYIRQLSASERNKLMDLRKAFEDKNMQIFVKEASRVASTISMAQRSVERDGTNLSDAVEAYKWMLDTVATV